MQLHDRRCQTGIRAGAFLLLSLIVSLPLLSAQAAPLNRPSRPSVVPVRSTAPMTSQSRNAAIAPELLAANTRFGFKLFQQVLQAQPGKNVAISPSSVAIALTMTYNGAAGKTQQAMAKTLELQGLNLATINQSNAALTAALTNADPDVQLAIANSLWARNGVKFNPGFIQRNQSFYDAKLTTLDFANPNAVATINQWVSQNTRGKIPKMVDRLSPDQVLLLLNAIYFKGKWTEAFEKQDTTERPFTLANGTRKQHPLMSQTGEYDYLETKQFQAVSLPYGSGRWSLYVFLPHSNSSLQAFTKTLTPKTWQQWMSQFRDRSGTVKIPRFKLEADLNLNNTLKASGMGTAFDRSQADFSAMSTERLAIDQVKHKTLVEVNEEGTEAAASTSVEMIVTSAGPSPTPPFNLVADRPFFWAIRDNQTGTLLFMGTVVNP